MLGESLVDVLAAFSAICATMNLTILEINGRIEPKTKNAVVDVNIKLNSKGDLETVINKLKQNDKIIDVYRVTT